MEAVAQLWLGWVKELAALVLSLLPWCSSALGEGGGCFCCNAERWVCTEHGSL